jgi:large subunit ribosomal protein L4
MEVLVLDMQGKEVGKRKLSDKIFSLKPRKDILHFVVVNHLAKCRQGTQSTLTRSEVSGGGKKPWRQKGTGRARQGSIRAPHWTHGGIALGPKPRTYGFSINKKVRKMAMRHALSSKQLESKIVLVDRIEMEEYKTKKFLNFMKAIKVNEKSLFILSSVKDQVVKSARNIENVKTANVKEMNVYDILNCEKLILESAVVDVIEEVYK